MSELLEVSEIPDNQIGADFAWIKSKTTPKLVYLDPNEVIVDINRNHRDDRKTYDRDYPAMKTMVEDMQGPTGWILGSICIFHERPDGKKEAVRGHRRTMAARYAGLKKIPGILISGLTDEQIKVVIAETPPEVIGPIGEFKAVRDLVGKMGDQRIADYLRIKGGKNKVQEYRALNDLPISLQERWKQHTRKIKGKFPIGREQIFKLWAARNRDWGGQYIGADGKPTEKDVTLIDRNPEGGPEYLRVLNEYESVGVADKNVVNRKSVKNFAGGVKIPIVRDLILGIADEPGIDGGKALRETIDVVTKFNNLVTHKITHPLLLAFVNGFDSSDADLNRAQHRVVKEVVEDAIKEYLDLHPQFDPLVQFDADVAHKYEGALPPVVEEITPVVEEITPVVEEITPVVEETVPTVEISEGVKTTSLNRRQKRQLAKANSRK